MAVAVPSRSRDTEGVINAFKHFVGTHLANTSPTLVLHSDSAGELTKAAAHLRWLSEASIPNTWPHNAAHERFNCTFKSTMRAAMLQAGFPSEAWDLACPYTATVLSLTHHPPLLPHELGNDGKPLPEHRHKLMVSSWTAHHGGDPFVGVVQPFGSLCYYHSRDNHPASPTGTPGLFIGWRLENGLRYRNVLLVLDYERTRSRGFRQESIIIRPQAEVVWPSGPPVFPWAEARALALRNVSEIAPLQAPPAPELIFSENAALGDRDSPSAIPPPQRRFQITLDRILTYGLTEGCNACQQAGEQSGLKHTLECRERFRKLLIRDGHLLDDPADGQAGEVPVCLLYTSPSPRDRG